MSTMISPNRTSEILSSGSSGRLLCQADIPVIACTSCQQGSVLNSSLARVFIHWVMPALRKGSFGKLPIVLERAAGQLSLTSSALYLVADKLCLKPELNAGLVAEIALILVSGSKSITEPSEHIIDLHRPDRKAV